MRESPPPQGGRATPLFPGAAAHGVCKASRLPAVHNLLLKQSRFLDGFHQSDALKIIYCISLHL